MAAAGGGWDIGQRGSADDAPRERGLLLLQVRAVARGALGQLTAADKRLEPVFARLTGVLVEGHCEENLRADLTEWVTAAIPSDARNG